MARWKPSTVEDIGAWLAGRYEPNPTDKEFDRAFWARVRSLAPRRQGPQERRAGSPGLSDTDVSNSERPAGAEGETGTG